MADRRLTEDGFRLLTEDGFFVLLEQQSVPVGSRRWSFGPLQITVRSLSSA